MFLWTLSGGVTHITSSVTDRASIARWRTSGPHPRRNTDCSHFGELGGETDDRGVSRSRTHTRTVPLLLTMGKATVTYPGLATAFLAPLNFAGANLFLQCNYHCRF